MMPPGRPLIAACLIAVLALAGCATTPRPPQDPTEVTVVTVEGTIEERGEDRDPYECDRPLDTAALQPGAQTLTVIEDQAEGRTGPIGLALWEDVTLVRAGGWTACEWPLLHTSQASPLSWRLQEHELSIALNLTVDGEMATLGDLTLEPGESSTLAIDQPEDADREAAYTYTGNLTVTHHGAWPAENVETVDSEQELAGTTGLWATTT